MKRNLDDIRPKLDHRLLNDFRYPVIQMLNKNKLLRDFKLTANLNGDGFSRMSYSFSPLLALISEEYFDSQGSEIFNIERSIDTQLMRMKH